MPPASTQIDTALDFVQTLTDYLKAFNMLVVKNGEKLNLVNQNTGEVREFNDQDFPILFQAPDRPSSFSFLASPFAAAPATSYIAPGAIQIQQEPYESTPSPFDGPFGYEDGMHYEETDVEQTPLPLEDRVPSPSPHPTSNMNPNINMNMNMNTNTSLNSNLEADESGSGEVLVGELVPDQPGRHVRLEAGLAELQQRERIAICPPSSYPVLVWTGRAPDLVVTDVHGWQCVHRAQAAVDAWPPGAASLEIHPKTPDLLSNNMDRDAGAAPGSTGFFFHFKIFNYNAATCRYELHDSLTSRAFRTVSHSKLCDAKRRPPTGKKATKNKRVRQDTNSSSSERYEPY